MGSSAMAKVFYGIVISEEEDDDLFAEDADGDGIDWEVKYAATLGIVEPVLPYDERPGAANPEHHAFWDARRLAVAACAVEIDWHGYMDDDSKHVAVKASQVECYASEPKPLSLLAVAPEWDADLRAFCEAMKIPWKQPQWILAASYG